MTKADGLLLILICTAIGALFQRYWISPSPALTVSVTGIQGNQTYDLRHDTHFDVSGPLGASTLEIEAGRIRFRSSPCQHQVCVRSGWHSRSGSVAACVPNRISVLLRGGDSEIDGYSY